MPSYRRKALGRLRVVETSFLSITNRHMKGLIPVLWAWIGLTLAAPSSAEKGNGLPPVGDAIGLERPADTLDNSAMVACRRAPTRACVVAMALAAAETITEPTRRDLALFAVFEAQTA